MKKFLNEFKEFALRGNVLDLAIGVLIGGAFQGLVTSLTENIISPLIGLLGGADFSAWTLDFLGISVKYGSFITAVIVFIIVKGINKLTSLGHKKDAPAAPTTKVCPYCKSEISIEATRCPHCTSELTE